MLLYINGQLADLDTGQVIAQTRQVNDLNSLDNRQAGYTNKFRLPKTANNIRIMDFLTLTGNHSNIPYQKNECSLYGDSGECFVYKGWAVITDGGDDYEAVVYDGIIDLYKAIENKSLAQIDLQSLDHTKNLETVTGSWTNNNLNYRYIIAHFNGKQTSRSIVNLDYLVPSVRVSWLWEQLFAQHGFEYKGNIFNTPDFKNLWITFPKGILSIENEEVLFSSNQYAFTGSTQQDNPFARKFLARYITADEYEGGITDDNKVHLIVPETGYYKVVVSGKLKTHHETYNNYGDKTGSIPTESRVEMAKNARGKSPFDIVPHTIITSGQINDTSFTKTVFLTLNAGDSLCFTIGEEHRVNKRRFIVTGAMQVKLSKVDMGRLDFTAAFTDFAMRDFLNEVVHRFGLTMYKDPDKTKNSYTFLTLKEVIEESGIIDFSRKFSKKISENYIHGNYARLNWMRYNYNEKEDSHNDGCLQVANENLPDSRDVLKSKLYSPEKEMVVLGGYKTNIYKLWEQETQQEEDNITISYKPLDKRYYFLREERDNKRFTLRSYLLGTDQIIHEAPFASFAGLSFQDTIANYYRPLQQLLNRAAIVNAELLLTEQDVANFDFSKRYYIEQLGSNFIMNKINNYVPGKPVKCELIRIASLPDEIFTVQITRIVTNINSIWVYYQTSTPVNDVIVEYGSGNNGISIPLTTQSPAKVQLPYGTHTLRIRAAGKLSNSITASIPSVHTVYA